MNKKSQWHLQRQSGSLTISSKSKRGIVKEGKGKRAKRRERQEKEQVVILDNNKDVDNFTSADKFILDIDERTEEEKEADAKELADALNAINRKCIEKFETEEELEKQRVEENKLLHQQEQETEHFISTMASNMGFTLKQTNKSRKRRRTKRRRG